MQPNQTTLIHSSPYDLYRGTKLCAVGVKPLMCAKEMDEERWWGGVVGNKRATTSLRVQDCDGVLAPEISAHKFDLPYKSGNITRLFWTGPCDHGPKCAIYN
jgi:hypothetical protein